MEGISLYSYGHSWTMWPNPWCSQYGGEYPDRVRTRLGMGRGWYRGRSGTPLQDTIPMMLSTAFARQWTPGSHGIVLHQNYMNEASTTSGQSTLYRSAWKKALRTAFALWSSSSVISADDATRTGTWTKLTNTPEWFWASDCWFSKTPRSTMTFSTSGSHRWLLLADSCATYETGRIQVKVGSQTVDIDTDGLMEKFTSVHTNPATGDKYVRSYTATAYRVPDGGPITVTVLDPQTCFVSACFVSSPTPPHIFYGLEPPRNPSAGGAAYFATSAPLFAQAARQVAAEFDNAHIVDLGEGWDNSTMISSLDPQSAHPNDRGMDHIAGRFTGAIASAIPTWTDGVWVL